MIRKNKKETSTDNQQPQENNYKLGMGSTPHSTQTGGFLGQTIPVKHSERKPLSLEENQKEHPGSSDFLYGIPGAYIKKSSERRYNTESGWYEV